MRRITANIQNFSLRQVTAGFFAIFRREWTAKNACFNAFRQLSTKCETNNPRYAGGQQRLYLIFAAMKPEPSPEGEGSEAAERW
jgi:hypothetical protein